MEVRQRRSFTDDYKRQAVDLVASSGRSIGSVAKELGLRDSVLRRWVEQRGAGLLTGSWTVAGCVSALSRNQDPNRTYDPSLRIWGGSSNLFRRANVRFCTTSSLSGVRNC